MLDQQDGDAFPVDALNDGEDRIDHLRRESKRRLIQQEESRMRQQPTGNRKDLLLATGQLSCRKALAFAKNWKLLHQRVDLTMNGAAVVANPRPELEVLPHRQPGQDLAALGNLDQALPHDSVRRSARQVETIETRAPRLRSQHAGQGVEDRRLAGSVGADQRDDLAVGDAECDTTDRLNRAIRHL